MVGVIGSKLQQALSNMMSKSGQQEVPQSSDAATEEMEQSAADQTERTGTIIEGSFAQNNLVGASFFPTVVEKDDEDDEEEKK